MFQERQKILSRVSYVHKGFFMFILYLKDCLKNILKIE